MLQLKRIQSPANATSLAPSLEQQQIDTLQEQNDELRGDILIGSLENYVDKYEGMLNADLVNQHITNPSLESAALLDLVCDILSKGTDLKGSDDLIPGLESHVTSGIEDSPTTTFKEVSGKILEALMEKIRQLATWITEAATSVKDKASKIIDRISNLGKTFTEFDGDSITVELPKYRVRALNAPITGAMADYIKKIGQPLPRTNSDMGYGELHEKYITPYTDLLSTLGKYDSATNDVLLSDLNTSVIHGYKLPTVDSNGQMLNVGGPLTEARSQATEKSSIGVNKIVPLLEAITKQVEELGTHVKNVAEDSKAFSDNISSVSDPKALKYLLEVAKLNKFCSIKVPNLILDTVATAVMDLQDAVKKENAGE